MIDTVLESIAESLRRYTAFRAWFAEVLITFSVLTLARLGAKVWDGIMLDDLTPWAAWWTAYDSIGSFADDSLAFAIAATAIVEGGSMFLAKKRIAITREDALAEGRKEGREEGIEMGREEGIEVGREEGRAESAATIAELRERLRRAENGSGEHNGHS